MAQTQNWNDVVENLFTMLLDGQDLVIRPTMVPFDAAVEGTVCTFFGSERAITEEIISSCDFETFARLACEYLEKSGTHSVVVDRLSLFVYNKASERSRRNQAAA